MLVRVDSLLLQRAGPTLPDRRGFTRTRAIRVERSITTTIATGMADDSLLAAAKTPFKGDLTAAPGTVRTYQGDAPVHPGQLLRHVGEVIHNSQLIDPDTGDLGRDARILGVVYDDDAGVSTVTLDNSRTDFETQLTRYEVTGR